MPPGNLGKVFCLEGDWWGQLTDQTSVRPMLELLQRMGRIEFVHKDVGTQAELRHYLKEWLDNDPSVADYSTLYLAFHGGSRERPARSERTIWLSDAEDGEITLRELAAILGRGLRNVVVHLGACSVLAETDDILEEFRLNTGIRALAGYTEEVSWVSSAAMDMLFLDTIADFSQWAAARRALDAHSAFQALRRDRALGFRMWPE